MTTVIVANKRAQPLFILGLGETLPPDIYVEINVEILDEINVTVCQED